MIESIQQFTVQVNVHDKYKIMKHIGEGAQGKVFLAERTIADDPVCSHQSTIPNNTRVAIKVFNIKNLFSEILQVKSLAKELTVHWALNDCDGAL